MAGFWIFLSWSIRKFRFLKYKKFFRGSLFSKYKNSFFWENIRSFFGVSVSRNISNFSRGGFLFYFSSLGWKMQGSIFGNIRKALFWENIRNFFRAGFLGKNIRNFFRVKFREPRPESTVFHFLKYRNSFSIRARKFDFLKYKEYFSGWTFFVFWGWSLKVRQIAIKKTPLKSCAK